MKIKAKFVWNLTVIDPDTNLPVEIDIYKMETGPMVGLDACPLEADFPILSPYDENTQLEIED